MVYSFEYTVKIHGTECAGKPDCKWNLHLAQPGSDPYEKNGPKAVEAVKLGRQCNICDYYLHYLHGND